MRGKAFAIQSEVSFVTEECCSCGVEFAILQGFRSTLQRTGQAFYCPNGHGQSYTETTEAKLRRELAQSEQALGWERNRVASLNKQLAKEQTATKKLKKRVSVGVCPCCQRTVSQLARHMQSKHPDFVDGKTP